MQLLNEHVPLDHREQGLRGPCGIAVLCGSEHLIVGDLGNLWGGPMCPQWECACAYAFTESDTKVVRLDPSWRQDGYVD